MKFRQFVRSSFILSVSALIFFNQTPAVSFENTPTARLVENNHILLLQEESQLRDMEMRDLPADEIAKQRSLVDYLRSESSRLLSTLPQETAAQELMQFTLDRERRKNIEKAESGHGSELLEEGYGLLESGLFEEAEAVFYEAIRLDDQNQVRILRHYEDLVQKNPENSSLLVWLGYIYYMAEEWPRAKRAFTEALRLDPENSLATHGLLIMRQTAE